MSALKNILVTSMEKDKIYVKHFSDSPCCSCVSVGYCTGCKEYDEYRHSKSTADLVTRLCLLVKSNIKNTSDESLRKNILQELTK